YREVSFCDILVCIIGGRYGTDSATREGSITQNELQQALERGIQVYIFIEQNVYTEFATYQLNKENKDTKYRFVDNVKVFEFLEKVIALPQNNPIESFVTSADVCKYLQGQWAGLFQRFLQEEQRLSEIKVLEEMKTVASTLQQLVKFLTDERKSKDEAIRNILLANHPAFRAFAKITNTRYRVFFTNRGELDKWLVARNYKRLPQEWWDEGSVAEWQNVKDKKYIKLKKAIFDDQGKLKPYSEDEWKDSWLEVNDLPPEVPEDDDVPS
ncbi:MAG TPA: DUF4062 domain-containing protein, partial [Syntrophorhabdales bacterium]|nr:DUF4062 domain-containing protein [Syntrophorhabdales bacterium]